MNPELPNDPKLLEADIARHRQGAPDDLVDGLFERVAAQTVDRRPTARDTLRELPTPTRVLLGFTGLVALGFMLLLVMGVRGDLLGPNAVSFGLPAAGMLALCLFAVGLALRGAHQGPLGALGWAGVAISVLGPLGLASIPGLWPGSTEPVGPMMHVMCLAAGSIGAFGCAGVVLLFSRADRNPIWRLLLASGAGGLAGFVFQTAHCPGTDPVHLVATHATYGLVVGSVFAGVALIRRRL